MPDLSSWTLRDQGRDEMDEKDRKIAHFRMVARNCKLAELLAN